MKKEFTTIIEATRKAFGVTRDEYALCAYIQYRIADPRNKVPGWCSDSKDDIADFIGITRRGVYKMISRMDEAGLLEIGAAGGAIRVTEKWIDAKTDSEQSSKLRMNKVHNKREQSSQNSVNKVPQTNKVYKKDNKKEESERYTPAQNASSTLEPELSKKEIMPPPPAAPPNWEGLPNANTAQEFQSELSRFYTQWPQEWRNVKEATPAMNWDKKKQIEVLTRFCTWAITEGWERRNFKKINARLRQWFKDEPLMGRVPANQITAPATLPGNIPTTGKR